MAIFGLSEFGAESALGSTLVLPNGTDKFVALLTALPTARDGTGLVEASAGGIARIAHQDWVNVTLLNDTIRKNSGSIDFVVLSGTDLPGIVGWAIYSAITVGDLIAFGPLVNSLNLPITRNFLIGDQPRFTDQELEVLIGSG